MKKFDSHIDDIDKLIEGCRKHLAIAKKYSEMNDKAADMTAVKAFSLFTQAICVANDIPFELQSQWSFLRDFKLNPNVAWPESIVKAKEAVEARDRKSFVSLLPLLKRDIEEFMGNKSI